MPKNSGFIVKTKSGKEGKTYHKDVLINGKMVVHIEGVDKPMLCDPKKTKIIGFFD